MKVLACYSFKGGVGKTAAGNKWKKRTFTQADTLLAHVRESDYSNLDLIPAQRSLRHLDTLLKQTDVKGRQLIWDHGWKSNTT